ncbi:alcohol dehydrogenase catalytic domain-containing protein [Faecalicatena contorta]|uniref:alcohol dehydrogenase catalytic domain-containing protein n=1 Tax=Faecalicatena contorta TaxID=39482 RepID=UPI001F45D52D|nr:alcohol dehydrogenase catalytic domain-containing protein [Faecalicatena contorta]MCF2555213.1 alcohol dehydrogenase catalytic domain-containing protein [Faecalicatena contorta]
MINYIYQLVAPRAFSIKYDEFEFADQVVVKPRYLAICHADQRYYTGQRSRKVLAEKLPMALVHEACGEVIYDPTGTFSTGTMVVMIPNVPADKRETVILENYAKGASFLSSGKDGFMREFVSLPADRLVSCEGIPTRIATVTEFVSVAVHSIRRFKGVAHDNRGTIGVWGDGSLAFVVSNLLKQVFPLSKVVVIGKNVRKLSLFSFVDETYIREKIPEDLTIDHAFECCGGEGSYYAIEDIIHMINPQGTVMLMGVSENKVAINTRDVLEKGLTFVGSSRSGRIDFEEAICYMRDKRFQKRMELILHEDAPVNSIEGIHRVFETDMNTPFKTIFQWQL